MKILITGITGFVGSHLAEYCIGKGEVFGIKRHRSKMDNIEHILDKITLVDCDMKDAFNVAKVIEDIKPDKIFHLAAQSFVPTSWKAPNETLVNNISGQLNLFEAVRHIKGYDPVIQIACSSEEYGKVDKSPITEETPLNPLSPYAVSKIAQDYMGYQYHQSYGMKIIRTRAFNHTGTRRGDVFVCSNFAKQVVNNKNGTIKVGNMSAIRDFTDVRDVVKAYWIATEKCEPGEVYNICSGKGYEIREILEKLINIHGKAIETVHDNSRMRPSDVPVLIGDNSKFVKATGWKPEISIDKTLVDLITFWENKL